MKAIGKVKVTIPSTSELQTLVLDEITRFSKMTTEEYILYQKWEEVQEEFPMGEDLFGGHSHLESDDARRITLIRSLLWSGNNYLDIEPELIWVNEEDSDPIRDHWTALRILIHTQQHSGSIGRGLNYLVRDKTTKKYLGVIAIASDFLDIKCRDDAIGWTREQRTQEQRIKHTAVCSSIVPVQPFGYNMVGGKLLALLCLSDEIQNRWQKQYGSKLVGLTTTSLYGKNKGGHGMSQYDRLTYWKKMGYSAGSSALRMSKSTQRIAYEWAKIHLASDYTKFFESDEHVRDRLNRFQMKIYRKLDIPGTLFKSNHDRGIYFASLYENTYDFLRDDITEDKLVSRGNFSMEALTTIWKDKYAKKRFEALVKQDRISEDVLFYADMAELSWEEARSKYLAEVGR